jgi:hypothetical protein
MSNLDISVNIPVNPFEKFQSKDNKVIAYTTHEGVVIKKIAGKKRAAQSSKIIKTNDYFVYQFSIPEKYLMRKYKNGVGINYAFFNRFSDNDIFQVTIKKADKVKESYVIAKSKAIKFGIIATERNSEQQIFIPINLFDKM